MTLRATNLNLLPILRALLTEGSITRAARVLGLSQPATSNALGRLRDLLGDPLLVQVGRTMRLTPRAERLRPMLDDVCAGIERLLLDTDFRAEAMQRDFVIATPDYIALLLGPAILDLCARQAPGVTVRFTDVPVDLRAQLASGSLDIAIIARIGELLRGFSVQGGYLDTMVGVVADDHEFAVSPPATLADLARYPKLGVSAGEMEAHRPDALGRMMAGTGALRLGASHLLLLPLLAARTQSVAVVPRALAEHIAAMAPVATFALPDPQVPVDACLIWSPVLDVDAGHRWLRTALDAMLRMHFSVAQDAG